MDNKYFVIIRPGLSELRALKNSSKDIIGNIMPIIELIRGRKKKIGNTEYEFPFDSKLDEIKDIFGGDDIIMDVTSHPSLMSKEIEELYDYKEGYKNWINLLSNLKEEKVFRSIIPTMLFNYDDPQFDDNIERQRDSLLEKFGTVLYRNSIDDENCYGDFRYLPEGNTLLLIDGGYIPPASANSAVDKLKVRLHNIINNWPNLFCGIIIATTSFPNNIGNYMDTNTAEFSLAEIDIHDKLAEEFSDKAIQYGDYGSINPIRNEDIRMKNGWLSRIDLPLDKKVLVFRLRRPEGESQYKNTYIEVAKLCTQNNNYHALDENLWGVRQINLASEGLPPGSNLSFWISVRMNIHLYQQIKRLKSKKYFTKREEP